MYQCFFEGYAFIRRFIAFAGNYIAQVSIADISFGAVLYRDCWLIISVMDVGQVHVPVTAISSPRGWRRIILPVSEDVLSRHRVWVSLVFFFLESPHGLSYRGPPAGIAVYNCSFGFFPRRC